MKYIDVERLRARIEKDLAFDNSIDTAYYKGRRDAERSILDLIDSLQQEEPERICPRCVYYNRIDDMCECPHGGMEYFINENGVYKCNMFEKVEQQEQPEVDLEKEIDDWYNTMGILVTADALKETARHFYELGRLSNK